VAEGVQWGDDYNNLDGCLGGRRINWWSWL